MMTPVVGVWLKVDSKIWQKQQEGTFDPFGRIYGTLRLDMVQIKWRDKPWES